MILFDTNGFKMRAFVLIAVAEYDCKSLRLYGEGRQNIFIRSQSTQFRDKEYNIAEKEGFQFYGQCTI